MREVRNETEEMNQAPENQGRGGVDLMTGRPSKRDSMALTPPIPLSDLRGYSRLAVGTNIGVTDIVETVHANILHDPFLPRARHTERTRGIPGLIYHTIRGTTRLVGVSLDALLAQFDAALDPAASSAEREAVQAAANGVLGDHLAARANPLAIPMRLRRDGQPLDLTTPALAAALPQATSKVPRAGAWAVHERSAMAAPGARPKSGAGGRYRSAPFCFHYNSSLHARPTAARSPALEALLGAWPVPVDELVILGHSMGGLLARSTCYYGKASRARLAPPPAQDRLPGHAAPRHDL